MPQIKPVNSQPDTSSLIHALRQQLGLTQEKFAAKLGVTCLTVNRWENGRAKPSPMALKLIESMLREMGDRGKNLLERYFQQWENYMALSSCPKCTNHSFETVIQEPRGSNFKLIFVQCSSCGAVVGVMEHSNIGYLLGKLAKKLGTSLN